MKHTDHIAMRGFTALEVVFVLVVLGILSAVAAPRFFDSRNQMEIRECGFRMEMMRDKMDSILFMEHEKTGRWLDKDKLTAKLKAAFDPSGEHFAEPTPHYKLDPHEGNTFQLQCTRHHRDALLSMAMPENNVTVPSYARTFWTATRESPKQFDPEKAKDIDFNLQSNRVSQTAEKVVDGKNYKALIWHWTDNDGGTTVRLGTSHSIQKIIASYTDNEHGKDITFEEYYAAQENVRILLGGYLPPSWRLVTADYNINLYWSDFNWNDIDNNYYNMENEIKTDCSPGETAEDYTEVDGVKSTEYVDINRNNGKWITTMPIIWMRQELTETGLTKMKYYVCLASFINPAEKPRPAGMDKRLPPNGRRILINEYNGIPDDIYPYTQTDVKTDIKVAYVKNNFTEGSDVSLMEKNYKNWDELMFYRENDPDAAKKAYAAYLDLKEKWLVWRYNNYNGNYKGTFLDKYVDKPN
ncbi:MAG: prepilin-type N-terminal cleavage/methylation domain-containing protein [Desulfovibrionaceae bacterium]|nr:prepilin-type N-terminal cleavage/methylation domain-containing protein [Desulfovibrionaceae bacterium]